MTILDAHVNTRFGIIVSRWNEEVTMRLLDGALKTLKEEGIPENCVEVVKVPGAFEIPLVAQCMAERKCFNALICLGAVIQGETTHHEHIGREVSGGIQKVSLTYNIPIGFGILTTQTEEQALERAGGKMGNKGRETTLAALEMVSLLRKMK